MHPKILRCLISGLDLYNTSQGDILFRIGVGSLLIMCVVVDIV